MKRSKTLRRYTRLKARGKTSYRRRERDVPYMLTVKRLGCCVPNYLVTVRPDLGAELTPCFGRVEADHAGERAFGRKASDDTCIPICQRHHGERTDYRGSFWNFKAAEMRAFCDWAIERTRQNVDDVRRITAAMG